MKYLRPFILTIIIAAVLTSCSDKAPLPDVITESNAVEQTTAATETEAVAETVPVAETEAVIETVHVAETEAPAESEAEQESVAAGTSTATKLTKIERVDDVPDDLPTLYIQLDKRLRADSIPRDTYKTAVFALDGNGFCKDVPETTMSIKGRGNYSWSFPKKPYNIKFDEKINLGGMGSAKKWTLVTTYSDKTMMRNYITLNLAKDIGMDCGADCILVNVVINGDFRGMYLLTERVQIQKNRINISEETGLLFEIEMKYRHSDCSNCIITQNDVHLMLKEPEREDVGNAKVKTILQQTKTFLNNAEKAMTGTSKEYDKYIDAESFAQWYIVNELCKNYDSIFVTSCYCYINDDGKLAMGSPWDYDTCYGNQNAATCLVPEGWYIANATWYKLLFESADFNKLVAKMWDDARENGIIDKMTERIDTFVKDKAETIKANNERWPNTLKESGLRGGLSLFTFDEEVEYLKNWLATRIAWLDEAITDTGINRNAVAISEYDSKRYGSGSTKNIIEKYESLTEFVDMESIKSNAEGNPNEGVANLFDKSENTKYCWSTSKKTVISFKMTEPVTVNAYAIKTANDTHEYDTRNPDKWVLSASKDGKTWTDIANEPKGHTKMSTENYTYTAFELAKSGKYQYFKLTITDYECTQMSEFVLLGSAG